MENRKEFIEKTLRDPNVVAIINGKDPSVGTCKCCGLSWNACQPHFTDVADGKGMFAVCEYCWNHVTDDQIREAYRKQFREWESRKQESPFSEDSAIAAVNNELLTKQTKQS